MNRKIENRFLANYVNVEGNKGKIKYIRNYMYWLKLDKGSKY